LIADCLDSPSYYKKVIAEIFMKVNFWDCQTGRGLVLKYSDFEKFNKITNIDLSSEERGFFEKLRDGILENEKMK
jgi:hypothetical protein